jgi:hypothetical protein
MEPTKTSERFLRVHDIFFDPKVASMAAKQSLDKEDNGHNLSPI